MIYDLLLKREIEDEYCLINNIMFLFLMSMKKKNFWSAVLAMAWLRH